MNVFRDGGEEIVVEMVVEVDGLLCYWLEVGEIGEGVEFCMIGDVLVWVI